jgi:hypothetical protein
MTVKQVIPETNGVFDNTQGLVPKTLLGKMYKSLLLVLLYLTFDMNMLCDEIMSSDSSIVKKNAVYFELGGNSIAYSVNYEKILYISESFKYTVGTGLSLIPGESGPPIHWNSDIIVSPQTHFLFGNTKYFDLGVGVTLLPFNHWGFIPIFLGYRYQNDSKRKFFRMGMVIYKAIDPSNPRTIIGAGISFGKCF